MAIIPQGRLNAEGVRALTERLLREKFWLQVKGYKITTSTALDVLLKAAIERTQYRSRVRRFSRCGR